MINSLFVSCDPIASLVVAAKLSVGGNRNARLAYKLVKENPGCTALELVHRQTDKPRLKEHQLRPRLTELVLYSGSLRWGTIRTCKVRPAHPISTFYVAGPYIPPTRPVGQVPMRTLLKSVLNSVAAVAAKTPNSATRLALERIHCFATGGVEVNIDEVLSSLT